MLHERLQEFGKDLILSSLGAIRTFQTHGWENQAAQTSIDRLSKLINEHLDELGGQLHLDIVDEMLLVNGTRLRGFGPHQLQFEQLVQLFRERALGGVAFLSPVTQEALRFWLAAFGQRADQESDRKKIRADLDKVFAWGIQTRDPRTLTTLESQETHRVSTMAFALQTFGRLVVCFREFVNAMREGRDPYANRLGVVRVVQDLVDAVMARPEAIYEVVETQRVRKLERPYEDVHAASTAVYSVLIARMLSLGRTLLLDVGTSALLADAAATLHVSDKVARIGALDREARVRLKAELTRSVQVLLGTSGNDDSAMLRTIVAYEHHHTLGTGRSETPHIISRIVTVASAYDAMLSDRPWRAALTRTEAVKNLGNDAGTRYDPAIVSAFLSLVGTFAAPPS
jgi:hypothetical protein